MSDTATQLYHMERYDKTVALAQTVINQRPDNTTARTLLLKGLIKLERWARAEEELAKLPLWLPQRDVAFLQGFLERHRSNLSAAVDVYLDSRRLGRRGVALAR